MAQNTGYDPPKIDDLSNALQTELQKYLTHLQVKSTSIDTIENNFLSVLDFVRFTQKGVKEITDEDIDRYTLYLRREKEKGVLGRGSQRVILSRVRCFLKHNGNPNWVRVIAPQNTTPDVKIPITDEEAEKIIDASADVHQSPLIQQRIRTMNTLLLTLNPIRREEVTLLKWQGSYSIDWNKDPPTIYIRRVKRGVPEWTTINPRSLKEIKKYLEMRKAKAEEMGVAMDDHLFVSVGEKPISRKSVYRNFKDCVRKAGVRKEVATHYTRHTLSTKAVESGADIIELRDWMGDRHTISAEHYIKTSKRGKRIEDVNDKLQRK